MLIFIVKTCRQQFGRKLLIQRLNPHKDGLALLLNHRSRPLFRVSVEFIKLSAVSRWVKRHCHRFGIKCICVRRFYLSSEQYRPFCQWRGGDDIFNQVLDWWLTGISGLGMTVSWDGPLAPLALRGKGHSLKPTRVFGGHLQNFAMYIYDRRNIWQSQVYRKHLNDKFFVLDDFCCVDFFPFGESFEKTEIRRKMETEDRNNISIFPVASHQFHRCEIFSIRYTRSVQKVSDFFV